MPGTYVELRWEPEFTDGMPRRYTRSGLYRAFVPESLADVEPTLTADLLERVALAETAAEQAIAALSRDGLGQVGDLLVRSEASSSSRIEGYEPTAKAVAIADFVERGRDAAVTVARNLRAVRASLARCPDPAVSLVDETVALQALITPRVAGVRTGPVWIGGATPLDAHYVAPPHDRVPGLLADLDRYVASRRHSPVVAAGLAHAQLETIHPFGDGNGRAGRVLIGMVLARYGLTDGLALPVSTELFAERERYYAALDAFRTGDAGAIIGLLADAVLRAAGTASHLAEEVLRWQREQEERLTAHLAARSASGRVRRGAAHRLVAALPQHPVLDAVTVARLEGISETAARTALESLADAGILRRDKKSERTRVLYVARDLLALAGPVADAHGAPIERLHAAPLVPVVGEVARARPGDDTAPACGQWMPRAARTCGLPLGHAGQHR